jgi:hypothetical protein
MSRCSKAQCYSLLVLPLCISFKALQCAQMTDLVSITSGAL